MRTLAQLNKAEVNDLLDHLNRKLQRPAADTQHRKRRLVACIRTIEAFRRARQPSFFFYLFRRRRAA